jgi:Holliday junction resolvasome RuvABC endonuclease subunit
VASGKPSKPPKKTSASRHVQMEVRLRSVLALAETLSLPGRVMGLDLALTNTGVVILTEYGSLLRSYTLRYPMTRRRKNDPPISEDERIERLINLTNEIVGLAKEYKVRYVALEGSAYSKQYQAHQLGEINGNVKVQLWLACKVVPTVIPPTTARKHVLGFGNATKAEIQSVLVDQMRYNLGGEHEVDAYVVARYLWDLLARRHAETIEALAMIEAEVDAEAEAGAGR